MIRTEYEHAFMDFNRGLLEASKTHRPVTGRSPQAEQDKSGKSLSGRGGLVAAPSSFSGEVGGPQGGSEIASQHGRVSQAHLPCSAVPVRPASPPKLVVDNSDLRDAFNEELDRELDR